MPINTTTTNGLIARRKYWADMLIQIRTGVFQTASIELMNKRGYREGKIVADDHEPALRISLLSLILLHAEKRIVEIEKDLEEAGVAAPPFLYPHPLEEKTDGS